MLSVNVCGHASAEFECWEHQYQSEKRCLISPLFTFLSVLGDSFEPLGFTAHTGELTCPLLALLRSISTLGDLFGSRSSVLTDLVSAWLLCGAPETAASMQKAAASV